MLPYPLFIIIIVTTITFTMIGNYAFGFKCYSFCINQYLLKVSKLMNKDLVQNKVFNYFNTGDAKTLVKLKEK